MRSYSDEVVEQAQVTEVEKRVLDQLDSQNVALAQALSSQVQYLLKRQNKIVALVWTLAAVQLIATGGFIAQYLHMLQ